MTGTNNTSEWEGPNQTIKRWKEIKMNFTGKDRQVLQMLIGNDAINPQIQEIPRLILYAIQNTLKVDRHFWHYCDELVSDLQQKPDESIHSLITHIIQLINDWDFFQKQNKENTQNHHLTTHSQIPQAKDWIHLQDQSTLTYDKLLSHCRTLKVTLNLP